MDLGLTILLATPGLVASVVALEQLRRSGPIRRHSQIARLGLLAGALLLAGACHSIDRNAFAHSPVPLSKLAFHEPLTFTGGAADGQVVPFLPGLVASYFAGAQYDRLDHQQIDPNVDFVWDGTGNPVISAPDGIDHNDGDFRLPDSWGIWSVVWEGYLITPAAGTYLLRIHVNNGGWLEMKDPSGALVTVIDCAGGTSFEGDCDASPTLTAGPHYIRFSYYNNAPPTAVARLLWQPPGATALSVVPTSALQTQATQARRRAFMYVHGTTGVFGADDFHTLLGRLELTYTRVNYRYYEDRAFANPDHGCHQDATGNAGQRSFLLTRDQIQSSYPFSIDNFDPAPGICDSNDDIELNAVLLDADLAALESRFDGVTLVSNSGGGAIVRAYLAYATSAHTGTLNKLDAVMNLEGVEHGTYLAAAYNNTGTPNSDNPVVSAARDAILQVVRDAVHHDPTRPAFADFTPQGPLISFYNLPASIPDQPHYVNVAGDIVVHVNVQVFIFTVPAGTLPVGDGVMRAGRDDPAQLPLPADGGARFLPSTIGKGRSSTQWPLHREFDVTLGSIAFPAQVGAVLGDPAMHMNLSRMHEICVTVPGPTVKRLDDALFDAFTALDTATPDPLRIGFGNMTRVTCP